MSIVGVNPRNETAWMRWRLRYLIFVVVKDVKDTVSEPVKVVLAPSKSALLKLDKRTGEILDKGDCPGGSQFFSIIGSGDGKIFVLPMEDCIRIRTGEHGPDAIG